MVSKNKTRFNNAQANKGTDISKTWSLALKTQRPIGGQSCE